MAFIDIHVFREFPCKTYDRLPTFPMECDLWENECNSVHIQCSGLAPSMPNANKYRSKSWH